MNRAQWTAVALISLALAVGIAHATGVLPARPSTEPQMMLLLNGTPVRWALPDGGQSGAFGSGQQCADLTNSGAQLIMFVADRPVNFCARPSTLVPLWDGGCSTSASDINFGVPLQANVPQYLFPDPNTTTLCFVSDAGSEVVPLFKMY